MGGGGAKMSGRFPHQTGPGRSKKQGRRRGEELVRGKIHLGQWALSAIKDCLGREKELFGDGRLQIFAAGTTGEEK